MSFPLIDRHDHQMAAYQTLTTTTPTTITIISSNNDWCHHSTHQNNNCSFNDNHKSQRTTGANLGSQPIDPAGPWQRGPFPQQPSQPLNSTHTIQNTPTNYVSIHDYSIPPPGRFQHTPPRGFYSTSIQENDSFFSEASSSMTSLRHREEGSRHWDHGSDSAKCSTPIFEDQNSYWRPSYQTGSTPLTSCYPPEAYSTLPYPSCSNSEFQSAIPCRGTQAEDEDWADNNSVFDWDQYKLAEEVEREVEKYGEKIGDDVESDCRDVVDMEICSVASESNDEDNENSRQPTQEGNASYESDRLTDSQMLSLLRHLAATDKKNNTNKNICHTIELFLTLLPVQMQRDKVELRRASMSSVQTQIFELLQGRAPWVVDEQIIRSMDLLPFILKRILAMEFQQPSVLNRKYPAPHKSEPSDQRRQSPDHRRTRRGRHSPRRSRSSPSSHRRRRDRSRTPLRKRLSFHRKAPPTRERTDPLPSIDMQLSPPQKGYHCIGRGRNIFTRSPEPRSDDECPRTKSRRDVGKPSQGHRAEVKVRLQHIHGDDEEGATEAMEAATGDDRRGPKRFIALSFNRPQTKRVEAEWKRGKLDRMKRRNRQPVSLRQTSAALRLKKRAHFTKRRLANGRAPSLMTLSLPPLSLIRQAVKPTVPKKPPVVRCRQQPSILTAKVPLLAAPHSPQYATSILLTPNVHMAPMHIEPIAASHRGGLLPDPGSREHLMIIGMKTVSRLGLQSKFR